MVDQRGSIPDHITAAARFCQLRKIMLGNITGLCLLEPLFQADSCSLAMRRCQSVTERETRVPDFEDRHISKFVHVLTIRSDAGQSSLTLVGSRVTIRSRCKY